MSLDISPLTKDYKNEKKKIKLILCKFQSNDISIK